MRWIWKRKTIRDTFDTQYM